MGHMQHNVAASRRRSRRRGLRAAIGAPVCALALLAGCGGGGGSGGDDDGGTGGGGPVASGNLGARSVRVLSTELRTGYALTVAVEIAADRTVQDVPVALYAIEQLADPEAEALQVPLGDALIPQVDAGQKAYEVTVTIPSNVRAPAAYYVAALIDPLDAIAESDEDDNDAAAVATIEPTPGTNILLADMALDRAALLLDTDAGEDEAARRPGDVYNADASAIITVGADGLPARGTVDIEAFATLRLHRRDTGTSFEVPLYLWNSALGRYTHAFGVDPGNGGAPTAVEWLPLGAFEPQLVDTRTDEVTLDDVKRDAAMLGFYLPGKLGGEIEQAMRYPVRFSGGGPSLPSLPSLPPPNLSEDDILRLRAYLAELPNTAWGDESAAMAVMDFAVCVDIRTADAATQDLQPDDNRRCAPLSIVLPPVPPAVAPVPPAGGFSPALPTPAGPVVRDTGFRTRHGGRWFSFGLGFGATETMNERGYRFETYGDMPVTLFGSSFPFVGMSFVADLVPDYRGLPSAAASGWQLEISSGNVTLAAVPPSTVSPSRTYSYARRLPVPEAKRDFFIGPVPLTAGAELTGTVGIEVAVGYGITPTSVYPIAGYELGASVRPFANADVTVYAGVGNRLYSAGVEGVLQFFDEQMRFSAGTAIAVANDGHAGGDVAFEIRQGLAVRNTFKGPQGLINLYARYSEPRVVTCSWGFAKFKCIRFREKKAVQNLWRTPRAFVLDDVLWDNYDAQQRLGVVIPADGVPLYFTP